MVSHNHKCIFIHIPKTGGMSVEKAFLGSLGLSLGKGQNHPLLLSYNADPSQGPPSLGHLPAIDYCRKSYLSPEIFNSYFKFSFVRNPWSRIVSIYRHFDFHRYMTFETFLEDQLPILQQERNYFVMPQVKYLFDEEGNSLVDFIGRFENIQEDFELVRMKILKAVDELEHINKGPGSHNWYSRWNLKFVAKQLKKNPKFISKLSLKNKNYTGFKNYYSDKTKEIVYGIYKKDIDAFDYKFDD